MVIRPIPISKNIILGGSSGEQCKLSLSPGQSLNRENIFLQVGQKTLGNNYLKRTFSEKNLTVYLVSNSDTLVLCKSPIDAPVARLEVSPLC